MRHDKYKRPLVYLAQSSWCDGDVKYAIFSDPKEAVKFAKFNLEGWDWANGMPPDSGKEYPDANRDLEPGTVDLFFQVEFEDSKVSVQEIAVVKAFDWADPERVRLKGLS